MFVLHGAVPLSGQTARNQPGRHGLRGTREGHAARREEMPADGRGDARGRRVERRPRPRHTQEGPATSRVTGPSARKCPSLVSDVLLSHGLLRSTIGARGLNFRVRNGTGCTSPAMVADQRGAFGCQGAGSARCPGGRTAQRVSHRRSPDRDS